MTLFAAFDCEWLCLRQFARSSLRHVRYFRVFLFLTLYALLNPRRARVLRHGFCALQWIDDLLDGDRPSPEGEPLERIAAVRAEIEGGTSPQPRPGDAYASHRGRPELRLIRALCRDLDSLPTRQEARHELVQVISVMMRDRERVKDRLLLSGDELRTHHRGTFRHSLNLTLIGMESRLRADDMPAALELLGWCSTIRDLDEDLKKGLVNIPREVLAANPERQRAVERWLGLYRAEAAVWLESCERRLEQLAREPGIEAFKILIGSTRKYFLSRESGCAALPSEVAVQPDPAKLG
jgi:hypothetical protein